MKAVKPTRTDLAVDRLLTANKKAIKSGKSMDAKATGERVITRVMRGQLNIVRLTTRSLADQTMVITLSNGLNLAVRVVDTAWSNDGEVA